MSASFTRRAKYLTFAGLATVGLALAAQVAVTPIASAEDPYTVPLNNTDTEDNDSCPQGPTQFGYHFVLPTDTATFVTMTVTFDTGLGTQVTLTAPPAGTVDGKHAWVYAPGDYTIVSGSAVVIGGTIDKVVFSHYCAGVEESPSATPTTPPATTPPATTPPATTPPATTPPATTPPATTPPATTPPATTPPATTPPATTPPATTPPATTPPATTPPATTPPATTPPAETTPPASETPTPEVSGTVIESPSESPSETVSEAPSESPTVLGERETRGPAVLPTTGNAIPVGLLLILGFGLIGAGVVATVTGEPHAATAGGKHRK